MNCPNCGSDKLKKNGFTSSGKQRYFCKECKKYFSSFDAIVKEPKKECVYCNGTNTVKSGRGANNKQIWLCKDCNRKFIDGVRKVEQIEQKCPYCDGDLTVKGWSNAGTIRRYKCKSCGKTFSGDLDNLQVRKIDKPCPYCGSENVKKSGVLRSGVKRYKCNDCGKGFNANTVVTKETVSKPEKCPKCGATHISKCGHDTKTGKQRYKCVTCGHRFVKNPTQHTFKIWKKECPICGHIGARKAGKSSGKQYYQCFACGHKYLEGALYTHITKVQKEQVRDLYRRGLDKQQIAKYLNKTETTVNTYLVKYITSTDKQTRTENENIIIRKKILNGFNVHKICAKYNKSHDFINNLLAKDYAEERITQEQHSLIVKFGVNCAVPVPYLAPYVKCSENMCNKILSKYTIKTRKQKPLTEQEKAFDRLELDKFMR